MRDLASEFQITVRYLRHVHAERWLSAYADGEAPSRRASAVQRHLAECHDCEAVVEFILASKVVLGRAGEHVRAVPTDG